MKWSASPVAGVRRLRALPKMGLSKDPSRVHGTNSGAQAVNLAYHLGATRIVLLGYDMQHTGGRRHCHQDYPAGWLNAEPVKGWASQFAFLARDLAAEGVEVLNASRETALTCVPRMTLACALSS